MREQKRQIGDQELRLPERPAEVALPAAKLPSRRGDLSLEQIKEWVDAYRAKNDGKFPSQGAGPVVNADGSATGEMWNGISQLLRVGQEGQRARGLQHSGFSSLADFLDKTYSRDREVKGDLSLEQIKEWVDAYRVKNDGKFPSIHAGSVENADGSATGETWSGIHWLFFYGQRDFPARGLQHSGFSSLADFLDKTYSGERKVRVEKGDLSLEQIKEWVDAYRAKNDGSFPSLHSGPVVNADGSATRETWLGINTLFRSGQTGRPARGLRDAGFSSLADFLNKSHPGDRDVRGEKEDLSLKKIKEWVDAYRVQNGGNFPTLRAGPVVNADGSATGETWVGLHMLLGSGQRGRAARGLKDSEFSSLADFLDKSYPGERGEKVRVRKEDLSLEQIKTWVDVYRAKNGGIFPNRDSGPVVNADGSATGETWNGIDHVFVRAQGERPVRGLRNIGFSSFPNFLDKIYPGERARRLKECTERPPSDDINVLLDLLE